MGENETYGGWTAREMEAELVKLSTAWMRDRDEVARAEYRRLHPIWLAAKRGET